MTGAELRAWRERLGKDEAWIEGMLRERIPGLLGVGGQLDGTHRRQAAEGTRRGVYSDGDVYAIRAAYRAALEAEEARQAAERGPVEPVCPEGVWSDSYPQPHHARVAVVDRGCSGFTIGFDGTIRPDQEEGSYTPALLEYAAALSRHRAAVHAASDKRRKLDAVRAAEDAVGEAHKACEAAHASYRETEALVGRAVGILTTARREAGL